MRSSTLLLILAPLELVAAQHAHLWKGGYMRRGSTAFRAREALETPPAVSRRGRLLSDVHEHTATLDGADTRVHLAYTAVQHERHTLRLLAPMSHDSSVRRV